MVYFHRGPVLKHNPMKRVLDSLTMVGLTLPIIHRYLHALLPCFMKITERNVFSLQN